MTIQEEFTEIYQQYIQYHQQLDFEQFRFP